MSELTREKIAELRAKYEAMVDDMIWPFPARDIWRRAAEAAFPALLDLAERALRYEAALKNIAEWRGYKPWAAQENTDTELELQYESGANNMLHGLAKIARDALAPPAQEK